MEKCKYGIVERPANRVMYVVCDKCGSIVHDQANGNTQDRMHMILLGHVTKTTYYEVMGYQNHCEEADTKHYCSQCMSDPEVLKELLETYSEPGENFEVVTSLGHVYPDSAHRYAEDFPFEDPEKVKAERLAMERAAIDEMFKGVIESEDNRVADLRAYMDFQAKYDESKVDPMVHQLFLEGRIIAETSGCPIAQMPDMIQRYIDSHRLVVPPTEFKKVPENGKLC